MCTRCCLHGSTAVPRRLAVAPTADGPLSASAIRFAGCGWTPQSEARSSPWDCAAEIRYRQGGWRAVFRNSPVSACNQASRAAFDPALCLVFYCYRSVVLCCTVKNRSYLYFTVNCIVTQNGCASRCGCSDRGRCGRGHEGVLRWT